MPDTQISLDDLFERIRADKSSTFADGAPLSTIQAVQKDLKILFPESLVRFWQEFDGGDFGFGRICSVTSIGAEIEDAYSYNRPLKRWGWVPFGDTYGGDLLCFATIVDEAERISCEVIEWDHEAVVSDVDDDADDDAADADDDDDDDDDDGDDDDDDDDGDERGLSEDPYLNRYPDFRDLIADYYEKNPQALLDAKEHDRQVEAWKAKAPQDFKKIASDILPIPGMDKPTAVDKHAGMDNRTAMDQRADKRAAMDQPTAFDKHAATDRHAATDKPAAIDKPAASNKNVAETSAKTEKPAPALFLCPHCSNASFQLMWKLELPPGDDWDSEQAQLYKCGGCGFHGIGWYEESRRSSGDAASKHRGFTVGSLYWKSLAHWFTGCPEPENKQCSCYSHKWLKQQGRFSELSEHATWFDLKH